MSDLAHLTSAQLAALRAIDSPTIANAIEEFRRTRPPRGIHG